MRAAVTRAAAGASRGRARPICQAGSRDRVIVTLTVLAVLAGTPSSGHAQRVTGEARVGGGYDSNPALGVDPGNRRLPQGRPGAGPPPSMEDGVFRVGGWLTGLLREGPVGGYARLDLDGRVYGSGDAMGWERLRIGGLLRFAPVTPRCALDAERFDTSYSDDDAWTLGGGCGARVDLPLGFWLGADALVAGRFFDVGQVDALYGGAASVGWALDPVSVEVSFSAIRRDSDDRDASRTELAPALTARLSTEHVGGELGYRFVAREFDRDAASGHEHVGRLAVWGMPVSWIGGYVELELGHAEGGPQALEYERVQVVGGVRLALDWRPEPDALPVPADAQGPATVLDDGRVRFRFELPGAERASVVGTFNDWDPESGRLERVDGAFVGSFEVPPGRHDYALIVDGEPRRPEGASRYVSDGFGGENAVLVVLDP